MQMLLELVKQHAPAVLSQLQETGLTPTQSDTIIAKTGDNLGNMLANGQVNLADLLNNAGISDLLSKLDINSIASAVGVDSTTVTNALTTILPSVTQLLSQHSDGLQGLFAGLGNKDPGELAGNIADMAKGFFK